MFFIIKSLLQIGGYFASTCKSTEIHTQEHQSYRCSSYHATWHRPPLPCSYIDCCNDGRWKWSRASGSNKVPLAVSITKTSASSSAVGAAAEMVELLLWRQLFCKCLPMYTPLARRRCSFYYSLNRSSSQDSKQRAFLLPVPAHVGLTDAEGRTGGGRRGTN